MEAHTNGALCAQLQGAVLHRGDSPRRIAYLSPHYLPFVLDSVPRTMSSSGIFLQRAPMENPQPADTLIARIRDVLGGLTPEPLMERLTTMLEGFFEQFQLVSKRDLEGHIASIEQLKSTIADLERRMAELERP